jgi:hypothetical protein
MWSPAFLESNSADCQRDKYLAGGLPYEIWKLQSGRSDCDFASNQGSPGPFEDRVFAPFDIWPQTGRTTR